MPTRRRRRSSRRSSRRPSSSPPKEVIRRHDGILHSNSAPEGLAESTDSAAFSRTDLERMPPPFHPKHFFNKLLATVSFVLPHEDRGTHCALCSRDSPAPHRRAVVVRSRRTRSRLAAPDCGGLSCDRFESGTRPARGRVPVQPCSTCNDQRSSHPSKGNPAMCAARNIRAGRPRSHAMRRQRRSALGSCGAGVSSFPRSLAVEEPSARTTRPAR